MPTLEEAAQELYEHIAALKLRPPAVVVWHRSDGVKALFPGVGYIGIGIGGRELEDWPAAKRDKVRDFKDEWHRQAREQRAKRSVQVAE